MVIFYGPLDCNIISKKNETMLFYFSNVKSKFHWFSTLMNLHDSANKIGITVSHIIINSKGKNNNYKGIAFDPDKHRKVFRHFEKTNCYKFHAQV